VPDCMQAGLWLLTPLEQVFKAKSLLLEDFPGLERLQFRSTLMKQWGRQPFVAMFHCFFAFTYGNAGDLYRPLYRGGLK
jgi:hypothetical protein